MTVIARSAANMRVEITTGNHQFVADEPLGIGDDTGPNPYDLLLSALGACTVMTVRMYARRKGWRLAGVEVRLNTHKEYVKDCEVCDENPNARIDIIERAMTFHGDLTPEQKTRLGEIADRCPVHRTLTGEIVIKSTIA
jgi:putative redox protein